MGNIVLHQHQSLNGTVTDMESWMTLNDGIMQNAIAYYDTLDAIIVGGHTYADLAAYWLKAEEVSADPLEKAFAAKINRIKKYVLSRSPVTLSWTNTEPIQLTDEPSSLAGAIDRIKQAHTRNISVDSGWKLWQLLLQQGLFDELMIYVHPVLAASGEHFFPAPLPQTGLRLTGHKAYEDGILELRYRRLS